MKSIAFIATALAVNFVSSTEAAGLLSTSTRVPKVHHHRYLQEIDILRDELSEWKNSAAGQEAQEEGYYQENGIMDEDAVNDQLERFFMTKLAIEEAEKLNPDANFSIDTPFTLMTDEEFAKMLGESFSTGRPTHELNMTVIQEEDPDQMMTLATDKDWTTGLCVAPVKNQGSCGSCWAFAAVGALESANCIKTNSLSLFSEQEVTSCETRSSGCNGGWPTYALNYIKSKGGICSATSYPYTSGRTQQTGSCAPSSCQRQNVKITQVVSVPASETSFMNALNKQPMSVAVSAGNSVWKQYRGGVVSSCPNQRLDHAVLAVGYGTGADGNAFFKIKNSWGTNWGDKGFIYLKRTGACGVLKESGVYPTV